MTTKEKNYQSNTNLLQNLHTTHRLDLKSTRYINNISDPKTKVYWRSTTTPYSKENAWSIIGASRVYDSRATPRRCKSSPPSFPKTNTKPKDTFLLRFFSYFCNFFKDDFILTFPNRLNNSVPNHKNTTHKLVPTS